MRARARWVPVAAGLLVVALLVVLSVSSRWAPLPYRDATCTPEAGVGHAVSGYLPHPITPVPYARTAATALDLQDPSRVVGPDGVIHQPWDGYPEGVYHPVNMQWYAIELLESYRATHRLAYLERAIVNAEAMLAGAESGSDGSLWFRYDFPHRLHGDDAMTLAPPWYSGMAQGLALSLLVRLHEETGQARWADAAHLVLRSFTHGSHEGEPGFVHERENGCLWFEEYVDDDVEPVSVVNGHVYAVLGLAEYALAFDDPDAVALFDAGATTVRESFDSFRVPGAPSMYCAHEYCARTRWMPESYHRGVAAQLDMLAALTQDPVFAQQAATLREDAGF